jgi:hypothetical protein
MSSRIATGAYSAPAMLNLYRSIIRLHRKKLPPALRTMGNTYVRHEFDLHKKANLTQARSPPPPSQRCHSLRSHQRHQHHRIAWLLLICSEQVKTFARQWRDYESQMIALSNTSENVGRHMTDAELNGGRPSRALRILCMFVLDSYSDAACLPPQPWTGNSCIKWINLKMKPRESLPGIRSGPTACFPPTTL